MSSVTYPVPCSECMGLYSHATYITPGMELRKTKFSYQAEVH